MSYFSLTVAPAVFGKWTLQGTHVPKLHVAAADLLRPIILPGPVIPPMEAGIALAPKDNSRVASKMLPQLYKKLKWKDMVLKS